MTNRVTPLETAGAAIVVTLTSATVPCRISCTGLAGAEEVTIEHMLGGVPELSSSVLTEVEPSLGIYVPGSYRIAKPITAAASALCIDGASRNMIVLE